MYLATGITEYSRTLPQGSVSSDQCMGVGVFCQQSAYILNDGREQVGSTIYCHKSCRRGQTGRLEVKLVNWGFNPGYTSFKKM